MATGCGFKCAKFLLFVFNFIFWIAGAALLGIGIWFLVDSNALRMLNITTINTTDDLVKAASIAIVVVGGVMFIVGGLGCFGACTESSTVLIVFATILFILLAAQVAAGILAGVYRNQIMDHLHKSMNTTIQSKYGVEPDVTSAWDFMQVEFSCCGMNNLSEWMSSRWYNEVGSNTSQSVPDSCCVMSNNGSKKYPVDGPACRSSGYDTISTQSAKSRYVFIQGCYPTFYDWVKNRLAIIIGVAIGLIVIQIIGIIMACCMGHTIRNKNVYK